MVCPDGLRNYADSRLSRPQAVEGLKVTSLPESVIRRWCRWWLQFASQCWALLIALRGINEKALPGGTGARSCVGFGALTAELLALLFVASVTAKLIIE